MYVQLIFQVLLLMKSQAAEQKERSGGDSMSSQEGVVLNPDIADSMMYRVYAILYSLLTQRENTLKQFKLDYNITPKKPFPKYEVPWVSFWM